jgi:hypothetical protein
VAQPKLPHETLRWQLLTQLYRRVPPLKYWGVRRGYLKRVGWVQSNWAGAPIDAEGRPLPWLTYPAIHFLEQRIRPELTVFEYGSGQSTRWWARQVKAVHSVEDDAEWYRRIANDLPANAELRFAETAGGAYARSIADRGVRFDVVVIDGSNRDECAHECVSCLSPDGVVIWDNTEDPALFQDGLGFLAANGFLRLDFFGMTPLNMDPHTTSVLYRRDANCLGL